MKTLTTSFMAFLCAAAMAAETNPYFAIHVVDDATGRGVPLVELKTTNDVKYYTDSAGYVAYRDPDLMGGEVYFHVASDGYLYEPEDMFKYRGVRLTPRPGEEAEVRIKRINIAERLYRITGQGIYRDSELLGKPTPFAARNGRVMGQDSVQAIPYKGKILWLWGDTGRPEYPLGGFASTAATSLPPSLGGMAPSVGVDLNYFVGQNGFAKEMARGIGEHLIWLDGFMVVKNPAGEEKLLAHFARLKDLGTLLEHGLCIYNDDTNTFDRDAAWDLKLTAPRGHPFKVSTNDGEYFYFPDPYPQLRVRATWEAIHDPAQYEAWTPLAPGMHDVKDAPQVERDSGGKIVWKWKPNTAPVSSGEMLDLIKKGTLREDEQWNRAVDADTNEPIVLWGGGVAWNAHRKKYIMIANRGFGKPSFLGEVYYLESESPEGPWQRAKKIITHAKHSFYNPVSHPFFDEEGGRIIYLEGTYTDTFTDAPPTPRYNYNQIMYRLDLGDKRLCDDSQGK